MEKGSIFDFLDEINQSTSHRNQDEVKSSGSEENIIPNERIAFVLFPFFIQLIDQFKEMLKNLRNQTQIFQEKFRDQEPSVSLHRMITEDIKKIDLLQNNLLNYIRVNNPILKTNTINTLLEEELKKYQVELGEKKIKIFKALEKDLPETAVPDDQLRYILSCALQHIMTLIPPSVSFGLLTRSIVLQREKIDDKTLAQKKEKYVEILMAYTGHETLTNLFGSGLETQGRRRDGILDLTLRLVDAIVQRNRGMMRFEEDEKKQKTIISLKFPVERRKVVYYRPANELSLSLHQSKTTFEKLSSLEEMKKSDSSTHE